MAHLGVIDLDKNSLKANNTDTLSEGHRQFLSVSVKNQWLSHPLLRSARNYGLTSCLAGLELALAQSSFKTSGLGHWLKIRY